MDELYSGVPSVGAPDIQASFGSSYEATAGWLLVIPALVALAVEPVLFLLADRHPRRWFVVGGLAAMAASALVAAAAPGPTWLTVAVSVAAVASGCGVGLAQSTLCDANPQAREQVMTRWALLGELGDLAAPALFALLAAASLGWRTGYLIVGLLAGLLACLIARRRFPAHLRDPDEEEVGLLAALGVALRTRSLMFWLAGTTLCDLLDEILVVFAAIRLRDDFAAGAVARSIAIAVLVAAGALGLLIAERLLRRVAPVRLLGLCAAACAICYALWLAAPDLITATAALALVGLTATPLYPIAAAQAYAALPGRSGAVQAAGHIFTPLSLALPWLLGWIADQAGATAALAMLIAQPVGLAILALVAGRRS